MLAIGYEKIWKCSSAKTYSVNGKRSISKVKKGNVMKRVVDTIKGNAALHLYRGR